MFFKTAKFNLNIWELKHFQIQKTTINYKDEKGILRHHINIHY